MSKGAEAAPEIVHEGAEAELEIMSKGADAALEITDRGQPRTSRRFVEKVVRAALAAVGRRDLAVSLLLTGDDEIARVHAEFLDDPSPTDVIAFSIDGAAEIAVNVECAREVARRCGHAIRAEVALYIVHGILHVCGYDDHAADERARMRAAERRILASIGLRVAPVDDESED